ncbi:MAG: hypothetical protein A2486_14565 [Burkholderiales bacterium RIFOXYC12_FULL_65_23]|uniref:DUF748 domain-containing protein n=1 Tax=Malikia spinosa TaxID=86180 RepID=UPI0008B3183E|nr:MAG: hypothetical protein A2486_14565 [Burkholderiales bacterium RIFOXYC12_FULL_65_23]
MDHASDQPAAAGAPTPTPQRASPRTRAWRWLRIAGLALAGLLLFWLLAWAGLPPLLKWQLERQAGAALGRQVSVERVELKPWSLELELHGLRLLDAQGQGDQFTLERLYLDLDARSLLRLAPVLDALEFDRPHFRLRHLGGGRYDIDDLIARLLKPEQPASELPRFALFQLQLRDAAIDFIDEPVGRTQQIRQLTLKLPFLSSLEPQREQPSEPSLHFLLNGDPVDAKALLQPFAQARQGEARLHSAALDLAPYLPYWPATLPLRPTRGQLEFDLTLRLAAGAQQAPAARDDQAAQERQDQQDQQMAPTPLSLAGHLALRDVELEWAGASAAQPMRLRWDRLRFDGKTRLGWPIRSPSGTMALALEDGRLQVDGLALHEGDQPQASLARLLLANARIDLAERRLVVGQLRLEQPDLQLERDQRQRWMFERWQAALGQADQAIASNQASPAPGWRLQLDQFELADGRLGLVDRSPVRPVRLRVEALQLSAGPWSNALPAAQALPLELSLKLAQSGPGGPGGRSEQGRQGGAGRSGPAGSAGALRYQGRIELPQPASGGHPARFFASQGRLELDQLPLHRLEPYFAAALNLELLRAELGLRASVELSLPPEGLQLALRGDGAVERLRTSTLEPAERLLDWQSLGLRGLQLDLKGGALSRLKVAETVLSDYYARIVIDPQGRINLQQLLRQPAEASTRASATPADPAAAQADQAATAAATVATSTTAAKPATPPAAPTAQQARLEFGPISFVNGQVDFADHFIRPNYSARLSELSGSLGGFSNQQLKPGQAPELAALSLRGKVEGQASLAVIGQLNPLAQPLALDIRAQVDDLDLPPLSPYSIKYAGHGIERGKLGMTVRYQIAPDGQLQASNQILLKQLNFSERVEGSEAPNLPIRLAVALLADHNGVIDLNLPISGSINDPQFRVGPIVWRMVLNLIGKAVTAPFALIAQALGGSAEDFSQIDFAPGRSELDATARSRLEQVAQAMAQRPALRLTLAGQSDLERERRAYQQAQLQQRLLQEKQRQLERRGQGSEAVAPPTAAESAELLAAVYRRADIPKPRNLVGLTKTLPAAEMEALLLASIPVDADRMRELALARAGAVRDALVRLGVDHERLYLLAPTGPEQGTTDGTPWQAGVMLGLKTE